MTQQPQDREPQAVSPAAQGDAAPSPSSGAGLEPEGLRAGVLWMVVAGLLAGLVAWIVFDRAFPFFRTPQVVGGAASASGPASPAETARMTEEKQLLDRKNSIAAGAFLGALAALIFSAVEAVRRPCRWSALALIVIAVLLAAGLGALAGLAAQDFLVAWRLDRRLDPMQRTMALQGIFWGLVAVGVGLGLGLFAKRSALVLGTLLQALMSMVLFVLVYVMLAGVLFPIDDADRIVPASSGNRALWCLAALAILGLFLGLARRRKKVARANPAAAS